MINKFNECLKSENILYVSEKSYKKLFTLLFIILSAEFVALMIFLYVHKDKFFAYLYLYILVIFLLILFIIIWECFLKNEKMIINSDKILLFNFRGKLIKQMNLKQNLEICFNYYCFSIQDENKNEIKVCREKDYEKLFKVLNNNGKNVLYNEESDFYNANKKSVFFKKIFIGLFILIDLFIICFLFYNKREILSYYQIYKDKIYLKNEMQLEK